MQFCCRTAIISALDIQALPFPLGWMFVQEFLDIIKAKVNHPILAQCCCLVIMFFKLALLYLNLTGDIIYIIE